MTQNQFIGKYRNKQLTIERVQVDEYPSSIIRVEGRILSDSETNLFWTLYMETKTIHSDPNIEVVKFL